MKDSKANKYRYFFNRVLLICLVLLLCVPMNVNADDSLPQSSSEGTKQSQQDSKIDSAAVDNSEEQLNQDYRKSNDQDDSDQMPELNAQATSENHVHVTIHADQGTFPEGTSVRVSSVSNDVAMEAAKTLYSDAAIDVAAVEISFFDKDGKELEPAPEKKVCVSFDVDHGVEGDDYQLIHIQDDGKAEIVDTATTVTNDQATFTAEQFSVYALVGTSDKFPNVETYEFYANDGKLVSSQTVKKGDVLVEPEVPETLNGKTFKGWEDDSNISFDGFGTVGDVIENGRTIRLHANYENSVYLNYYDQYDNLIESQQVEPNSTVTINNAYPMVQVQPLTECQDGWSTVKGGAGDVSGSYTVGAESVDLYPILKEGYWVDFKSNSESSFGKQFISRNAEKDDKKAKKPDTDPVRQGYVFDQWYSDSDLKTPYDFSQDVTKPMTLYARYLPAKDTKYLVQYWIEYQKKAGNGVGDGTWDYKFLANEIQEGTTGQKATFDPDLIFKSPYDKTQDQYELNQEKTIAPEIKADGSTVYNVYYQCKAYDLSITIPKADGTNTTLQYTKVKYSADLTNFWNAVFQVRPESELFSNDSGFAYFDGHGRRNVVPESVSLSTMTDTNVAMSSDKHPEYNRYLLFYLEGLHGKAPVGKELVTNSSRRGNADERTYYLQKEYQFYSGYLAWLHISLGYFKGFTPMMEVSDGHFSYNKDGSAMVYYAYPEEEYKKDKPGLEYHVVYNADGTQHIYEGEDDPIRIYYKRNHYKLIFNTKGGPKVDTQSVLYEDDLGQYNPSTYKIGETTKKTGNEEYYFAGWYKDVELSYPFDFSDRVTMPAYDIELYAKWVPKTYNVKFDTGKGSPIDSDSDVEYGHTVMKPKDPTYEGHIFLGWTFNGRPWNFSSGVTEDITLKAEWRSVKAWKADYDLNGGTGTVSKADRKYYENAGVNIASQEGILAPDGKVFLGWKSSSDNKVYYPNADVQMPFGGVTLTAQWGDAEKTAELIYDYNFDHFGIATDGDITSTVSTIKNNSVITTADISSLRKNPSGYLFKGWYLDKECSKGPVKQIMIDVLENNGNRVYAKWNKISTVTYEDGVSGKAFADQTYTVENGSKMPEFKGTPSRDGYSFKGWSPEVSDTVSQDTVYVAVWEKNSLPVSSESSNSPQTGYDSNLTQYFLLLAAAMLLGFACIALLEKQRKNNE